jgi:transcriptional regulator with XRE-family HTH domain
MGKFYDLIQRHIDEQPYPPSERKVARTLGVTPSTLSNWREPKQLIEKRHIESVAELAGVTYARALDALLDDIGYMPPQGRGRSTA